MARKRSPALAILRLPINLDPKEGVYLHSEHAHDDRPITYLHVHECLELGYCHSGHGIFVIGEKVLSFSTGDVIFIPPGEPHFARSTPGTTSVWSWIYVDPARLISPGADLRWLDVSGLRGPGFAGAFEGARHPDLAQTILRLAQEMKRQEPGRLALLQALTLEVLVLAHRRKTAQPAEPPRPDYERLAPALQLLALAERRTPRIGDLARRCGLSEPQFRRVFRRSMGCTPLAYLNDLRVRMAALLLRTSAKSVLEISLETGFESVSSLHRAFRARMGTSPRAWRRQGREDLSG